MYHSWVAISICDQDRKQQKSNDDLRYPNRERGMERLFTRTLRAGSWSYMGAVASASFHVERHSAERVVIHRVLCRVPGNKRHRNCTVQSVQWKHSVVGVLPFLAHEPGLPGRAALWHILVDRRCIPHRLVEPQGYVHKRMCFRRSDSTRKGLRWLSVISPIVQFLAGK